MNTQTAVILIALTLLAMRFIVAAAVREGVKQALDHHDVNLGYLQGRIDEYITLATPKIDSVGAHYRQKGKEGICVRIS